MNLTVILCHLRSFEVKLTNVVLGIKWPGLIKCYFAVNCVVIVTITWLSRDQCHNVTWLEHECHVVIFLRTSILKISIKRSKIKKFYCENSSFLLVDRNFVNLTVTYRIDDIGTGTVDRKTLDQKTEIGYLKSRRNGTIRAIQIRLESD